MRGANVIGIWLSLAVLGGVAGFQLYRLIVVVGWSLIQSERFRPIGWSSTTIGGVAQIGILVVGMLWLGFVAFLEHRLRLWNKEGVLAANSRRLTKHLITITIAIYLLTLLIGLL